MNHTVAEYNTKKSGIKWQNDPLDTKDHGCTLFYFYSNKMFILDSILVLCNAIQIMLIKMHLILFLQNKSSRILVAAAKLTHLADLSVGYISHCSFNI